jgi:hypothetical protein
VLIIGIPRIDDKGMPVQPSQFLADAEFDVVDVPSDDDLADDWWGELLAREAPVPVG